MIIKIGTRNSKLAIAYTDQVVHALLQANFDEQIDVDIKFIKSLGDIKENTPIAELGGKGAFTQTLEDALIKEEIDVAVHSFKDLPKDISDETEISAVLKRNDPRDAIVGTVKDGAVIGTSSPRRTEQLKRFVKQDITVKPIRGNIDTRIKKQESGEYDAIVLALCGMNALGYNNKVSICDPQMILPAPGQGVIALQTKKGTKAQEVAKTINHIETFKCAMAERAMLKEIDGDCHTAVGSLTTTCGDLLFLEAENFTNNKHFRAHAYIERYHDLGSFVGKNLK